MSKNLIAVSIIASLTVLLMYLIHLYSIELPKQRAQNDYWEQEAKYSTENASLVCPPSKDGKPISPDSCKRQDHYRHDRQQQIADHKAQLHMRNTAVGGFILGLAGLILLWWTLRATETAAKAAGETLGVAKETLTETKNATRRELRAYIYCHDPEISIHHQCCGDQNSFDITLKFKFENKGQTPAYGVQAGCMVYLYKSIGGGPAIQTPAPNHFKIANYTQLHNGVVRGDEIKISLNGLPVMPQGNLIEGANIAVIVLVYYHDIFSVSENIDTERFNEVFQYREILPSYGGTMKPYLIKETKKKTV